MNALPDFIPFAPDELLLGYQKRWIADTSPLKIAEKSRRTGLTWAEAADDVLIASTAKTDGGSDVFYLGSNKEMAREFIDACAMWASSFNRVAGQVQEEIFTDQDKDILTYVIYFASGFKIKALSSNPKNLRGMQGVVVIDEAAFHEHLAEVLKAALALTMWGAKVRLISTHNGADNLFNQLIQDSRAGRKSYSVHTITLDDACKEGLYQRICQVRKIPYTPDAEANWKAGLLKETATEEDALEEYYCVPKMSAGVYIPRPLIERAMQHGLPVKHFTPPVGFMDFTEGERERVVKDFFAAEILPILTALSPDERHCFGVDFARNGDLSVFAVMAIEADTTRRVALVLELANTPYHQQRQLALLILNHLPRLIGAAFDATGNGGYLAEAVTLRYGTQMIDSVKLNDNWYRQWSPKYKALYEAGLIRVPQSEDFIADHAKFQVINGVPKLSKTRTQQGNHQRHGDSVIACIMAVRASYLTGGEIDFMPLPPKHPETPDDDDAINDYASYRPWH